MMSFHRCPDLARAGRSASTGCPDPLRGGNHQLPIVALSELVSGRVAKGREGPLTTHFESTANLVPTLKGSGHPQYIPAPPVEKRPQEGAP
jgi:hypothetical protein